MATIRKRGSRWQVQVRRTGLPSLTRSFLARADAEAWARQKEVEIDRGEVTSVQRELKAVELKTLLARYSAQVTVLKRGAASELTRLRAMLRHKISAVTIDRLKPSHFAAYRDERLQQVSSGSVRRELAILQHCLEVARREWGIPLALNPVEQISKPPAAKSRERRLEAGELEALDVALRGCRNPLVRQVFLFALATGMRRGEVLSLTWKNMNEADGTAFLPLTKNGEARTVPLNRTALHVIANRRRSRQRSSDARLDVPVFPITANAFRLAWERVKRTAGVEGLRFHDLRHEAISRYFELGLSMPEVALISGHKDSRMLLRYTHLRAQNVAKKLTLLENATLDTSLADG